MRILHLNDRLSTRGGADQHLLGVLEWLSVEHEVFLAVGRVDPDAPAPEKVQVRVHRGLDSLGSGATGLVELARELRPDVIHVHNVMNPQALEEAAALGAVMTVQDHRTFCPGSGKLTGDAEPCREPTSHGLCARKCFPDAVEYFSQIFSRTRRRLRAVLGMQKLTVLSEYMRRELLQLGAASEQVEVIPPFVRGLPQDGPAPTGPPCVLAVGRLVSVKGVFDVAEAWRRSGVGLPLVMAGTGSARTALEKMGIEVTGWLDRGGLAGLYRRAACVVMAPRWQEPYGIVGLEALRMGAPIVAWDSGGVREWLPHPPLPWGDIDALARAIAVAAGAPRPAPRAVVDANWAELQMARLSELYRSLESVASGCHST